MTQIAGQFITSVGGVVMFTPFGGTWGAAGNQTPECGLTANGYPPGFGGVSQGNTLSLDVADWTIDKQSFLDDTTNTGSYGAQSMDVAAEGWRAIANVILDARQPADMLARYGIGVGRNNQLQQVSGQVSQYGFNLGCRTIFVVGTGVAYPADLLLDFYWSPSAKIGKVTPIIDANSKKMVRMSVEVVGNSRLFHLPAEGLAATDYVTHLTNRGQVF